MKPELLEFLIRECAKEVLTQLNEVNDETQGAAAPPADGQGTGDQPAVPLDEPNDTQQDEPEPEVPTSPDLKGIVLVNPKDKSKLQKLDLKRSDDATLERSLHRFAASIAGSKVKVALSTLRQVRDAVNNPNGSLYLYIGKYDEASDELFLLADKSLQVAKESSVPTTELQGAGSSYSPTNAFNPMTASGDEYAQNMTAAGRTVPQPIGENTRDAIKALVNQILDGK